MKVNVPKGWIAFLSFGWGLFTAIIILVLEETRIWTSLNTISLIMFIFSTVLIICVSVVKEEKSDNDQK